ncbi:alpha/beta hydrolase [Halanaerobium kushneri]|jgi:predicted alpha/beta superfamily hydrolase|uniref:Predicted hydrolase of the alpha/beta superfamily n=1 Tax=Halanaerobium kushneri TaxID=56779 RepID=A0A1N7BAY9_9FIRM|nr:alpha/beta hydrolase-fold protein [Halanaerobium kushneri]SIR48452.1 Predicted hydrolase of the alpha/beta superfamily [Halanaerobium kushneri]
MIKEKIDIKIIKDFKSEVLNNSRKIRIYLPPSYSAQKNKFYSVLYVHDGQNVFYGRESFSGDSWNLHQTAERLIRAEKIEEIIIVAADNMGKERLSEYAHQDGYYRGKKVKARGFAYEKFIIRELMPFIEENYRVRKGPENTALMGSSMGGLVTFNIGLRRSDLFGKLAVMSPSFWWGKSSPLEKINSYNYHNLKSRIWLDTGEAEGKFMSFTEDVISRLKELKRKFKLDLIYYQVPGAVHSETAWAARVHCPLLYFYGDFADLKKLKSKDFDYSYCKKLK